MNTNGSGGGGKWGWECWGWAGLEDQGGEASHVLLWGLLGPPGKTPRGQGLQAAPQQQIQALGMLDQVSSGAEGAKGLHPPQNHPWP